jgi:hypothetical protein
MRRRITLISGVAAIVVLASFTVWRLGRREHAPDSHPQQREDFATRTKDATAATPVREETGRLHEKERAKAIVQAVEKSNVPINFWGKVLDQEARPIGGVSVQYSYSAEHANTPGTAWGEQKIHKSEVATDIAGKFTVNGIKGPALTVEALTKEGYAYRSRGAKVYNYYGDVSSGKFTPDRRTRLSL